MDNLVSIITPMYNAENFVEHTILSVITQSYQNWEMIVINDCSTDTSAVIVEKYKVLDARIHVIYQEKNEGIAAARNKGMMLAKGQFIAFIDSDDIWKTDKLAQQMQFMHDNKYAFTYTACLLIDESGHDIGKTLTVRKNTTFQNLLKTNGIVCSSVIIDRKKIQITMPQMGHEDYATWLDILQSGQTAHGLDEILTEYRIKRHSVSANKLKSLLWVFRIYKNHLHMPLLTSLWCIIVYFFYAVAKYANKLEAVYRKKQK